MSDTNGNSTRLDHEGDGDPRATGLGGIEAPGGAEPPDSLGAGGERRATVEAEEPRQGSVEREDAAAAERDVLRDATP